jgi:hypothetical protein
MNELRKLEAWAIQVLDRVTSGAPIEDARVELKSELIEAPKAARRIAGHANAAHGDPILWLIGVDEQHGVVGVGQVDTASWLTSVYAEFQGTTPPVIDLAVSYANQTVLALRFDTHLTPFLVRNPRHGKFQGENIAYEVPWREGTMIRTARREELLRMLLPKTRSPEVEVLSAKLYAAEGNSQGGTQLWFIAMIYIAPLTQERIVFPHHKAFVEAYMPPEIQGFRIPLWRLAPSNRSGLDTKEHSEIKAGSNELIVEGPGMVNLRGSVQISSVPKTFDKEARAVVVLPAVGDSVETRLDIRLRNSNETRPEYEYEP